jgi:hypothetical protein
MPTATEFVRVVGEHVILDAHDEPARVTAAPPTGGEPPS